MGEVYRARDSRLGRQVATKVATERFSDRFEREAQALAALNHPHICQIYDVGLNYLVMELIDGTPLEGPLSVEKALPLALQITSALEEAHRQGAANAGVENMGNEIVKLRLLRSVGLPAAPFAKTPMKVLQLLKRRAWNEKASEVREHPEAIRYALLGCFLHVRTREVLDDVIRMAIDMVHRVDVRSDHQLNREWIENWKHVDGQLQILSRIAEAVVTQPDGIIREVLFPAVKESSRRRRFPLPQNTEGFSRGLPRRRIVRPRAARRYRRRARHEHSRARQSLGRRLVGRRHPSRSR